MIGVPDLQYRFLVDQLSAIEASPKTSAESSADAAPFEPTDGLAAGTAMTGMRPKP